MLNSVSHYLALIRIGLLCVNASIFFNVLEGIVHQATTAAIITIISRAVNQLLLTQGHQLPSLPEVLALQ